MRRLIWLLMVLALALGLASCSGRGAEDAVTDVASDDQATASQTQGDERIDMDSTQVTDRDRRTAASLSAPDDVTAALEAGAWPSYAARESVRLAEATEDVLAERYGISFTATDVGLSSGFLDDDDLVTLSVDEGLHAGESVTASVGDPNDAGSVSDTYPYLLFHEAYEGALTDVATQAFSGLGDGMTVVNASLSSTAYEPFGLPDTCKGADPQIDASALAQVADSLNGFVSVYVSPEANVSQEELDSLTQRFEEYLKDSGLHENWRVMHIVKPLEGATFDREFIDATFGEWDNPSAYDYNVSGEVG